MDYMPDPETGLLTEEYVDVYGISFSIIPFKGCETKKAAPEDKPKRHVRALPEGTGNGDAKLRLRSRYQLFPQVYAVVDAYVRRKVRWQDCHPCELGLATDVERAVERLYDAIEPDDDQGEPPLLPILNRYKPIGSTTEVDFKTTRSCYATIKRALPELP